MKRITLFFLLLGGFATLSAQNVPNGDFETWGSYTGNHSAGSFTYELPDFWKTTDSISMAFSFGTRHSVTKESSEVQNGTYAMKLTAWNVFGTPAPAAASNGDIDIATLSIVKGTPDTIRHATLNGYYRFAPVGGDTAYVQVTMLRWNTLTNERDTIAYGEFAANQATSGTTYVPFEITLGYRSTEKPDTMVMLVTTSPLLLGSGHDGTIMYVDNLNFSGVVGINEAENIISKVNLFPSPATEVLHIRTELKSPVRLSYRIYDLSGKLVLNDLLEPTETSVDIRQLKAGNYSIQLLDMEMRPVYSAPVQIIR